MLNSLRVFFFLLILNSLSFGCGLCTVNSPLTMVKVVVDSNKELIKNVKVTLVLTKEFTDSLFQVYDKDANNILDAKELIEVEKIFLEYVEPKNYFLKVFYEKIPKFKSEEKFNVSGFKSYIDNKTLHFTYLATLDLKLYSDNFLKLEFVDKERFFYFH